MACTVPGGILLVVCLCMLMVTSKGVRMDGSFLSQVPQTLLNGSITSLRSRVMCIYNQDQLPKVQLQSIAMNVEFSDPTVHLHGKFYNRNATDSKRNLVDLGDVASGQELWYNLPNSSVSSSGYFVLGVPVNSTASTGFTSVNCSLVSDELSGYDEFNLRPVNFVSIGIQYQMTLPFNATNMEIARATIQGKNVGKCCVEIVLPTASDFITAVEYGGNSASTDPKGSRFQIPCVSIAEVDPDTPCRVLITTLDSVTNPRVLMLTIFAAAPDPPVPGPSTSFWTTGAIVGVSVGAVVGVVLCLSFGWWIAKRRGLLTARSSNNIEQAKHQYQTFA